MTKAPLATNGLNPTFLLYYVQQGGKEESRYADRYEAGGPGEA